MADDIRRIIQQLHTPALRIIGTNDKDLMHSAYAFIVYAHPFASDNDRQAARVVRSTMLQKASAPMWHPCFEFEQMTPFSRSLLSNICSVSTGIYSRIPHSTRCPVNDIL
ncbi:hypothetical protein IG631_16731 [Alternaria alternata]|nr:hypothetical protein IG631_16731 [Alternaria alternata]